MLFKVLILAAIVAVNLSFATTSEWGYPNMDDNETFPKWGGLCDNGIRQSPIDLSMKGAFKSDFKKLHFKNYDKKQVGVSLVNNGHTIQLYDFEIPLKINGGPLREEFKIEQLHFHWWSEHTINNIRYPLECHIVHRNERYPNMTEAAKYEDGITVIAVLYHVSNDANEAIEDILDHIDEVRSSENINKPTTMKEFTVSELLPDVDGYFTYAGSLTTPTCAESVTWLILHETFPVTLAQVDKFKQVEYDKDKPLLNNYRFEQKTHNRPVVAVMYDDNERERGDGATNVHLSVGLLALMAIARLMH